MYIIHFMEVLQGIQLEVVKTGNAMKISQMNLHTHTCRHTHKPIRIRFRTPHPPSLSLSLSLTWCTRKPTVQNRIVLTIYLPA